MSFIFNVPKLREVGAWLDYRSTFRGGSNWSTPAVLCKRMIIHHSVTNPLGNAYKEAAYLLQLHNGINKWPGIGYNFMISTEEVTHGGKKYAKVAYVGDLATARAHTTNALGIDKIPAGRGNMYLLGIVFIGRFDLGAQPTEAQLRSAHELVKELVVDNRGVLAPLNKMSDIRPHSSYNNTACPGDYKKYFPYIINGVDKPVEEDMKRIAELEKQLSSAETALQRERDDLALIKEQNDVLRATQLDLEGTIEDQQIELVDLAKLVDELKVEVAKLTDSAKVELPKNAIANLFYILFKGANK